MSDPNESQKKEVTNPGATRKRVAPLLKKPSPKNQNNIRFLFVIIVATAGAYMYLQWKKQNAALTAPVPNKKNVELIKSQNDFGVSFGTVVKENSDKLFADLDSIHPGSCTTDLELLYCNLIEGSKNKPWGVKEGENGIMEIAVNGIPYRDEAMSLYPQQNKGITIEIKRYREDIWLFATLLFLRKNFKNLKEDDMNNGIRIQFWTIENDTPVLGATVVTAFGSRLKLAMFYALNGLEWNVKNTGPSAYKFLKNTMYFENFYGTEFETSPVENVEANSKDPLAPVIVTPFIQVGKPVQSSSEPKK